MQVTVSDRSAARRICIGVSCPGGTVRCGASRWGPHGGGSRLPPCWDGRFKLRSADAGGVRARWRYCDREFCASHRVARAFCVAGGKSQRIWLVRQPGSAGPRTGRRRAAATASRASACGHTVGASGSQSRLPHEGRWRVVAVPKASHLAKARGIRAPRIRPAT